ncbi:MAG TPA: hypothetical protein VHP83_12750, partial [Aggregatilineaceae bacterium]|nr:hypothetical protein [Aggregatilineaceae bacterium]
VAVPDDETIGDVIGKLFDPSFESVLAALAGEDISGYDDTESQDEEGDWITASEAREGRPSSLPEIYKALIDEPPINPEDSSGYPATAALNALTGDESEVTLDDLLSQIEQHFPPKMTPRPSSPDDDDLGPLQAMFNDVIQPQDTQPSQSVLEEIESYAVQDADTVRLGLPEELEEVPPQMLSMAELLAMADLPVEADLDEMRGMSPDPDLEQAFYNGVRNTDYEIIGAVDDDHLIPVPAETAAMMAIHADELPASNPEEDLFARIAVQLTQFSLESSAQATILSRLGKRLAVAGPLPHEAMERLFEIIDAAWSTSTVESASLIRFVTLPDFGDFLLYSGFVEENLILSMVFQANTPVNVIRRQARRLAESLAFVPEVPEEEASPTWPSRPTEPKRPADLVIEPPAPPEAESQTPARPTRPDTPYVGYSCLWIPADSGLELNMIMDDLNAWIQDIAEQNAWDIQTLSIRSDAVLIDISVPSKTLPDHALTLLMAETARRCEEMAPHVHPLWADGYYVVTPPRPLGEREIASYMAYQRQAQMS